MKLVIESGRPIKNVAEDIGVRSETLRLWVKQHREENPSAEPGLDMNERARLKELERINREQAKEIEFLKKAAAYFTRDRP